MVGITSFGVYVPAYRLPREEIARVWKTRSRKGERAVARFDEDTLTMAANAGMDCMKYSEQKADALFFGSTTPPYREKQTAAIIAAVTDHPEQTRTADFAGSLRSGTIALSSAIDAVKSGAAKNVIVAVSDSRMGPGKSQFEQQFGDGAVALSVGSSELLAAIEAQYSIFDDSYDTWRTERTPFVQSWEERFTLNESFMNVMKKTIAGILEKCQLTPADFSKAVFYAPDGKAQADLARAVGFDPSQVQDPSFDSIGNTGTAALPLMLVTALCEARPGDRILVANYGDGGDAFVLKTTENLAGSRAQQERVKKRLNKKIPIDYGRYLTWRGLVPLEQPRRPQSPPAVCPLFTAGKKKRSGSLWGQMPAMRRSTISASEGLPGMPG